MTWFARSDIGKVAEPWLAGGRQWLAHGTARIATACPLQLAPGSWVPDPPPSGERARARGSGRARASRPPPLRPACPADPTFGVPNVSHRLHDLLEQTAAEVGLRCRGLREDRRHRSRRPADRRSWGVSGVPPFTTPHETRSLQVDHPAVPCSLGDHLRNSRRASRRPPRPHPSTASRQWPVDLTCSASFSTTGVASPAWSGNTYSPTSTVLLVLTRTAPSPFIFR